MSCPTHIFRGTPPLVQVGGGIGKVLQPMLSKAVVAEVPTVKKVAKKAIAPAMLNASARFLSNLVQNKNPRKSLKSRKKQALKSSKKALKKQSGGLLSSLLPSLVGKGRRRKKKSPPRKSVNRPTAAGQSKRAKKRARKAEEVTAFDFL